MLTVTHTTSGFPTKFELFKLLRVVGEGTAQSIIAIDAPICDLASEERDGHKPDYGQEFRRELLSVDIKTVDETFHLFTGKVVKQGFVVITATIRRSDGVLDTFQTKAPFIATLEIPGVHPGLEADIQFKNILIENDLKIKRGILTGKIHLVEFVKVSEFVQRYISATKSPAALNPTTTCICRA